MRNADKLRIERRQQYLESNRIYQTKLREEKLQSWKDFCTNTENANPWNGVYRYAAGKLRNKLILTTLKAGNNNNYTTDIHTTINQMIERFAPEDSEDGDEEHHKRVRHQELAPLHTSNDGRIYETRSTGSTGNVRPPPSARGRCPVQRHTPARFQEFPNSLYGDLRVLKKKTLPKAMEKIGDYTRCKTREGRAQRGGKVQTY
jgi:hypothetical protein